MSTPFSVLPQYQGNLYQLQRQQQLAQALTQSALQGQQLPATVGSGPYQVAPRASIGAGISQLGQALLASRLSNQAAQGLGQLGAQNWATLTGQGLGAMSGANANAINNGGYGVQGGTTPPLQSAPAEQQPAGNDGSAGATGVSDQLSQQQPQGMLSPGGPMNPIGMPVQQAAMMYMSNPDKYWEAQAGAYKPTDTSLMLRQAGIDPTSAQGRQIMQQAIAKQNYIAPTSLRPGGYAVYADGREEQLPQIPEGFTAQRGPNGWQIVPVQGGTTAMSQSAAAKASGKAQYELGDVWDPTANGGQGGYVRQTVANIANAANGVPGFSPFQNATRQVESGGRADAVNPASGAAGSMQVTPTGAGSANPGFGVRPAANNSPAELQRVGADYAAAMQQRYGNDADAAVAYNWGPANADKWIAAGRPWKMLPDETKAYIGQVMTQQQNFAGSKPAGAPQAGPMASQPPLGQTQAANASQAAPSKQMADAYSVMSTADANYQQSREALTEMIGLANSKGGDGQVIGYLPQGVATRISPDAAKYQKLHATYVALQGKALGNGGTDAARATIDEAVPTYDKPQSAMVSGLQTQLANLDMAHLKTQFLTPIYQQGNEKAFTAQSAAFDQNIKPSMMPKLQTLMSMPPGAERGAALKAATQDPSMKGALDLLSGMFK